MKKRIAPKNILRCARKWKCIQSAEWPTWKAFSVCLFSQKKAISFIPGATVAKCYLYREIQRCHNISSFCKALLFRQNKDALNNVKIKEILSDFCLIIKHLNTWKGIQGKITALVRKSNNTFFIAPNLILANGLWPYAVLTCTKLKWP